MEEYECDGKLVCGRAFYSFAVTTNLEQNE